jgi:CRISPR-associated protein Cmr6
MAYPFYEELQQLSRNMTAGNYGLWYNKFIPIKDFGSCKASDERGNENDAVLFYYKQYNRVQKPAINKLLVKKHQDQTDFCAALSSRYKNVVFRAKLKTPLITGIGETHPHEVSMVFDHNLGTPYIPASGIKGIVRFVHTLGLLDIIPPEEIKIDEKSGQLYFNDEKQWTVIPRLFGTQDVRGSVIFLDAYPEQVPDLHIDIMNPHYGKYYNEGVPPADYLDPNPIKFLTVAKDTDFIFRALIGKDQADLVETVKNAFEKALTAEGVGAKTAVGYGLFDILTDIEGVSGLTETKKQPVPVAQDIRTPLEKLIKELDLIKANDMGRIGTVIQKIDTLDTDAEKGKIAKAIRDKIGAKAFKKHKQKEYILDLIAKAKQ